MWTFEFETHYQQQSISNESKSLDKYEFIMCIFYIWSYVISIYHQYANGLFSYSWIVCIFYTNCFIFLYPYVTHIYFHLICTEKSNFDFKIFLDNWLCSPFYFRHVEQSKHYNYTLQNKTLCENIYFHPEYYVKLERFFHCEHLFAICIQSKQTVYRH